MNEAGGRRGNQVPVASLRGDTAEATEALRTLLYLRELDRQAAIFANSFDTGRSMAFMASTRLDDTRVWGNLQGALFAAIVVQRLLRPAAAVRKHDHHESREDSQRFAVERGRRLCQLLSVPDDSAVFTVAELRNDFEHVDERLDGLMRSDVASVSDWYITDGIVSRTGPAGDATGYGLRVFIPTSGLLLYDRRTLDLYALDVALLRLRAAISRVEPTVRARFTGQATFGAAHLPTFASAAGERTRRWRADREAVGYTVAEGW